MGRASEGTLWRQVPDGSWEWQASNGQWHPAPPQGGSPALGSGLVPREPQSTMPAGAWLAIAGGVLGVVSAFLPWVTFTSGFVNVARDSFQLGPNYGFSVDGVVLIILGVITVVIGITRLTNTVMPGFIQRSPIVSGIVIALVAGNRISGVNGLIRDAQSQSSVVGSIGVGLYAAIVAGVLAVVGGIILRSNAEPMIDMMAISQAWRPCTNPECFAEYTDAYPSNVCEDCGSVLGSSVQKPQTNNNAKGMTRNVTRREQRAADAAVWLAEEMDKRRIAQIAKDQRRVAKDQRRHPGSSR